MREDGTPRPETGRMNRQPSPRITFKFLPSNAGRSLTVQLPATTLHSKSRIPMTDARLARVKPLFPGFFQPGHRASQSVDESVCLVVRDAGQDDEFRAD